MELATAYMYDDQYDKAIEILEHVVEMQKGLLDSSSNKQGAIYLLQECRQRKEEDDR